MNQLLFYRRRAERFAQLLDEANGGRRHHVRSRVRRRTRRRSSQWASGSASTPRLSRSDPDFRTGLRAMLLATAEREGHRQHRRAAEPSDRPAATATARGGCCRRSPPAGPGPGRDPGRHRRRRHRGLRHLRRQRERHARRRPVRHEALHRTGPARAGQLRHQPRPALPGLRPDPARRGRQACAATGRLQRASSTTWTPTRRQGVRLLTAAAVQRGTSPRWSLDAFVNTFVGARPAPGRTRVPARRDRPGRATAATDRSGRSRSSAATTHPATTLGPLRAAHRLRRPVAAGTDTPQRRPSAPNPERPCRRPRPARRPAGAALDRRPVRPAPRHRSAAVPGDGRRVADRRFTGPSLGAQPSGTASYAKGIRVARTP